MVECVFAADPSTNAANYELRDYRGRTPLHLAAEYDRSLSAQYLLGLSPPASCDARDLGGLMALSVMVQTMPKVVSRHSHTHILHDGVAACEFSHSMTFADYMQHMLISKINHWIH